MHFVYAGVTIEKEMAPLFLPVILRTESAPCITVHGRRSTFTEKTLQGDNFIIYFESFIFILM